MEGFFYTDSMRRFLQYITIFLIFLGESVFAADIPFTDVRPSDPYYKAVKTLYNNRIISDDGSHLFRPNEAMSRDFYVALSVSVGCKKCETPWVDDVVRYQSSPFVDLAKTNPQYYCISYAKDLGITQWYTPDSTGKAYCENGIWYDTPPFCGDNKISRIEWVAILLRRANLWNDTLNTNNTDTSIRIPDVTPYWYGYAKKGIEAWFLFQWSDGSVKPDEKISRGEFAIMAEKTLAYTQCNLNSSESTIESSISILDSNGKPRNSTSFRSSEAFSMVPVTSSWTWGYSWTALNPSTGQEITLNEKTFPSSMISDWSWIIRLDVINLTTKKIESTAYSTINIGDTTGKYNGSILIRDANGTIQDGKSFTPGSSLILSPKESNPAYSYSWEVRNNTTGKTRYGSGTNYDISDLSEGSWTLTLITRDGSGKIIGTVVRHITIESDNAKKSDNTKNGSDKQQPPSITITANPLNTYPGKTLTFTWITSNWATNSIKYSWDFWDWTKSTSGPSSSHSYTTPGIYPVTLTVYDTVTGLSSQSSITVRVGGEKDSDNDGISDSDDLCPLVRGDSWNKWCPLLKTFGKNNKWSTSAVLGNNTCLTGKKEQTWVAVGSVTCNICPCKNSATVLAPIQSCDVVFPAILSPDWTKVYSRWSFYIVP